MQRYESKNIIGLIVLILVLLATASLLDIIAIAVFYFTKSNISRKLIWVYGIIATIIYIFTGGAYATSREMAGHIIGAFLHGLFSVGMVFLMLKLLDPLRKQPVTPQVSSTPAPSKQPDPSK